MISNEFASYLPLFVHFRSHSIIVSFLSGVKIFEQSPSVALSSQSLNAWRSLLQFKSLKIGKHFKVLKLIPLIHLWYVCNQLKHLHLTYFLSISVQVLSTQSESNPHSYKSYTGMAIGFLESGAITPSSLVIRIVPLPSRIFKLQGSSRVVAYSSPVYSSPFVYPHVEPMQMIRTAFITSICTLYWIS